MENRRKVYVCVNCDFNSDGDCSPRTITFDNGQVYEIDRVISCRKATSTKVGGIGVRYTIVVFGRETFLFLEQSGRWFVEAKC